MTVLNEKSRLIVSAAGIFISYSVFGVLQEKVTRGRYGSELNEDGTQGERFTFTLALVGVQCLFNMMFAKGKYFFCFFTTSSLTMLRFQLFLSLDRSQKTQHMQVTTQAVHWLTCWRWWAATWPCNGWHIQHRWSQKQLSRFQWWF